MKKDSKNTSILMPFIEIFYLFRAFILGIKVIFNFLFIDIPDNLISKSNSFVDKKLNIMRSQGKINGNLDNMRYSQKISLYLSTIYNNIPYIKELNEQREAGLKILVINKDSPEAVKTEKKHTYRYLARNKEGKLIKGYFPALSKLDVYSYLIDEGLIVYEIETNKKIDLFHSNIGSTSAKMSTKDLIFWLTQVSTYVRAGIPLVESVKIIAKQDKRLKYKSLYDSIIYELTMGNTFSDALKKQGNAFPPLLLNMIKSSEMIGNIEDTLDRMAKYYGEIYDNRKAIIGALTYPMIISVFAIGVVVFMLVYIIPQFQSIYDSMGASLNNLTLTVIKLSNYLATNYIKIIIIFVSVILILFILFKKVKSFRTLLQYIIMHVPVIGKLIIYKEMSIFATTFATLNKNNVLLTDSIDVLSKITNNEIYKTILYNTINNLLIGEKMSTSFKDHFAVPDVAYYMIATGERTGELSNMLEKVGQYYENEQKNSIGQIKTLLEPVILVLLAGIVGFILIAVLIPMFGMYSALV